MKGQNSRLTRRLRFSGGLIIGSLLVQLSSLFWNHPLSFIAFVLVGGLMSAVGIGTYLLAIVTLSESKDKQEEGIGKSVEAP